MGMNESPPNEVDQAHDIIVEWAEKTFPMEHFSDEYFVMCPSKVILAMAAEINRLENDKRLLIEESDLILSELRKK